MKTILQHIKKQSQACPGSVLFVGAGNGSALPAVRELCSRQTVLVETDPSMVEELAQRIKPEAGETVWNYAITAEEVTPSAQAEVRTKGINKTLEALTLDAVETNILILHAPDHALDLLRAAAPKNLQRFNWILGWTDSESLYEDDAAKDEVLAHLTDVGFDNHTEHLDIHKPKNQLLLKRNDRSVHIHQLRTSLAQSKAERDQLATNLATALQELKSTQTSLAATAKELEAARHTVAEHEAGKSLSATTIEAQYSALFQELRKQQDSLSAAKVHLETTIKKETLNAIKQLEAFIGVQLRLGISDAIPEMHGWPISPDFALYLIKLIESKKYDLIIEFGSGTSTVLIAKALKKLISSGQGKRRIQQVAFEHLQKYHEKTQRNLEENGLENAVQLVLAPLVSYAAMNGNSYPYYDCHQILADLANSDDLENLRILVLVDGPPAATGKHARYPAVPVVLSHFSGAHIDILLDDYIRSDEKEITKLWISDIESAGLTYSVLEKNMEKDACLISITPS